ncbi:MAG: hypothetical protein NTV46_16440 [Verrucomicrobia bacterium]|nr:hypothetical protein [Verrucomicrobiota bacterium]
MKSIFSAALAALRINPLAFGGLLRDVARDVAAEHRKPFWLYPNLLSMDAPWIAVAWLYLFAKTWRLAYHPWEAYLTLGLAVWVICVATRLLDVSLRGDASATLGFRHQFYRDHRRTFSIGVVVAVVLTLGLVVTKMPMTIYRHLLLGGVMVAGFFGLSMLSSQEASEVSFAKTMLAGVTFAFGTAMMAHLYRWEYGIYDMIFSREFVCFAVLCILNISAIDLWEHAFRSANMEIKAADELTLTLPLTLLGGCSLVFALLDNAQSTRPFFYAVLTGTALLYILNRNRSQYSLDTLRVLADVALLVPVLVFQAASGE